MDVYSVAETSFVADTAPSSKGANFAEVPAAEVSTPPLVMIDRNYLFKLEPAEAMLLRSTGGRCSFLRGAVVKLKLDDGYSLFFIRGTRLATERAPGDQVLLELQEAPDEARLPAGGVPMQCVSATASTTGCPQPEPLETGVSYRQVWNSLDTAYKWTVYARRLGQRCMPSLHLCQLLSDLGKM